MNESEVKEVTAQAESTAPKQYTVGMVSHLKARNSSPDKAVTPKAAPRAVKTVSIRISNAN